MHISILMFLLVGASRKRESTTECRSTLIGCKCEVIKEVYRIVHVLRHSIRAQKYGGIFGQLSEDTQFGPI